MLIKHVMTESAKVDMDILNDVLDIIIEKMPNEIEKNSMYVIDDRSFEQQYKKSDQLSEKYQLYYDILLKHTTYVISNHENDINNSAGEFSRGMKTYKINIFLPAFFGETDNISKEELLSYRSDTKALKTFRSLLLHEMRHAIQSYDYGDYFDSSERDFHYDVDPIEIDAAWMHHLNDFDPEEYETAKDYVDRVMGSFTRYKYLNDKQKKHYRRKTARYYYEKKHDNESKPEDLETRKMNRIMSFISNERDGIMKGFDSINKDLREYGHPESQRFLLPKDRIRKFLYKSLHNPDQLTDNDELYLIFSLLPLIHNHYKFNTKNVEKYYQAMFGINSDKAINLIQEKGFGPLNKEFFVNKIKEVFK